MEEFLSRLAINFFIAFGIIFGGCMMGGVGAVFILKSPYSTMMSIADNIKVWAMVTAVGGTIDPFRVIGTNFADGFISPAIKQILFFVSAFIGAQIGHDLIRLICRGGGQT